MPPLQDPCKPRRPPGPAKQSPAKAGPRRSRFKLRPGGAPDRTFVPGTAARDWPARRRPRGRGRRASRETKRPHDLPASCHLMGGRGAWSRGPPPPPSSSFPRGPAVPTLASWAWMSPAHCGRLWGPSSQAGDGTDKSRLPGETTQLAWHGDLYPQAAAHPRLLWPSPSFFPPHPPLRSLSSLSTSEALVCFCWDHPSTSPRSLFLALFFNSLLIFLPRRTPSSTVRLVLLSSRRYTNKKTEKRSHT